MGDGVGEVLEEDGFAGAGRCDDEAALSLADGDEHVDDAGGKLGGVVFEFEARVGVERGEVVEENFVAGDFWRLEVDVFNFEHGEVAFALFWGANLAGDGVSGAEVEASDLRGRDVDVVGSGEVVVVGRAEESEAVREDFEDAFAVDNALIFGLFLQDREDHFLAAILGGVFDAEFAGDVGEVGDFFGFEVFEVEDDGAAIGVEFGDVGVGVVVGHSGGVGFGARAAGRA